MRGSDGRRVPGFCDTNAAKRVWVALMCTLAALTSLLMAYFIMFPVRGQLLPDDARLLKFAYSDPGSGGSVLQLDFEVRWAVQQKGRSNQLLTLCDCMCVPMSSFCVGHVGPCAGGEPECVFRSRDDACGGVSGVSWHPAALGPSQPHLRARQ